MLQIGKTRVRQHVNPLRREYQVPSGPIHWPEAFRDPSLPLVIDLGCGPGRFLMLLHKRRAEQDGGTSCTACRDKYCHPHISFPCSCNCTLVCPGVKMNYLGIEIREKLVERANEWTQRLGFQDNVHYKYSNATISLSRIMAGYPGPVHRSEECLSPRD